MGNSSFSKNMTKTKELTINSTLWKEAKEVAELENLTYDEIKIVDIEHDTKNNFKDYVVEYNGGGFHLAIYNLKRHFRIRNIHGQGNLKLLFDKQQKELYNKIWLNIANNIERKDSPVKYTKEFTVYDNSLPLDKDFKINKIIIVIKSVLEHNGILYPQISLNYCSYEV